jgi:SAM-dependent methyltransferase
VEDALTAIPEGASFDLVILRDGLEHSADPMRVLRVLRQLLAAGGLLAIATPNLESQMLRWYGPTWIHWDAPFHRHVFSPRSLRALAAGSGLRLRGLRAYSSPYWVAMTLVSARYACESIVHGQFYLDARTRRYAQRIEFWFRAWWDRRGRGDFTLVLLDDGNA